MHFQHQLWLSSRPTKKAVTDAIYHGKWKQHSKAGLKYQGNGIQWAAGSFHKGCL